MAERHGIETIDMRDLSEKDVTETIRDRTDGLGADSTIEAVGMGGPRQTCACHRPTSSRSPALRDLIEDDLEGRRDRMSALTSAIAAVRRRGTVSISGVYGAMADPMPRGPCSTRASR